MFLYFVCCKWYRDSNFWHENSNPGFGIKTFISEAFYCNKGKERNYYGDFLSTFHLLTDIQSQKFIDRITQLDVKSEIMTVSDENFISTFEHSSQFCDLLRLFPDITKPNILSITSAKENFIHYIVSKGQPVHSRE